MNKQKEAARGNRAERLLNDKLLKESFDILRENIHKKWEETESKDDKARELLWMQLKCLRGVQEYLKQIITKGKKATYDLEELNGRRSTGP